MPQVTAQPNCAPFKTQKILGSRAISSDSFDREYVDGAREDNFYPGRGAETHRTGYNVLYGDGHVRWHGDPSEDIIWFWPEYRSSGIPEDNPEHRHDWIDRSNLGAAEVWHLFDVQAGIDNIQP